MERTCENCRHNGFFDICSICEWDGNLPSHYFDENIMQARIDGLEKDLKDHVKICVIKEREKLELQTKLDKAIEYILLETPCTCKTDGIENLCMKCKLELSKTIVVCSEKK